MDIAVKWRYFRHLIADDDSDAERVYVWHIGRRRETNAALNLGMDSDKETPEDYTEACRAIVASMSKKGFDKRCPIPLDRFGNLLGGAHRLACALALDEMVWAARLDEVSTAPSWGIGWFQAAGMPSKDRHRLLDDWERIHAARPA